MTPESYSRNFKIAILMYSGLRSLAAVMYGTIYRQLVRLDVPVGLTCTIHLDHGTALPG